MIVTIALAAGTAARNAQTAEIISTYTSTAKKDCRIVPQAKGEPDDGFSARLPRDGGSDRHQRRGRPARGRVGRPDPRRPRGRNPPRKTGSARSTRPRTTIEWRHPKGGAPFAIIQRWHLADNDDTGPDNRPRTKQMLVVTRLPPGPVCHVAYVDVKANPNANELARQAADKARDFKCAQGQGAGGRRERPRGGTGAAVDRAVRRRHLPAQHRAQKIARVGALRQMRQRCDRAGDRSSAWQSRAPSTMSGRCRRSMPAAPTARRLAASLTPRVSTPNA